jgi:hypothetical protein
MVFVPKGLQDLAQGFNPDLYTQFRRWEVRLVRSSSRTHTLPAAIIFAPGSTAQRCERNTNCGPGLTGPFSLKFYSALARQAAINPRNSG